MPDPFDPPRADPCDLSAAPSADLSAEDLAKEEALAEEEDASYPWEADPPPDDPGAPRRRHDAFTEAKKSVFLRALVKTGCIKDASRLAGISVRTIYRHQEESPSFFENCRVAIRMSGTPAEITAWQRAVEGVEQEYAVGGEVRVRRRYSDSLLRLLLQGSNPGKYGPRPGFKRKRLLKHERKQIEREIRAELEAKMGDKHMSFDEAMELLDRRLRHLEIPGDQEKLAAGWTMTEDGHMVPPGYGWIGLPKASGGPDEPASGARDLASGAETPRDSM